MQKHRIVDDVFFNVRKLICSVMPTYQNKKIIKYQLLVKFFKGDPKQKRISLLYVG